MLTPTGVYSQQKTQFWSRVGWIQNLNLMMFH